MQHPFLPSSSLYQLLGNCVHPWPSIHPSIQLWPPSLGGSMGQRPVGRSHEPTALHASWERGCPRVNGACVVVQARSQDARGSGPIPVLTCKMTFRATLHPSLLCSISSPEHLGNGRVVVAAACSGLCAPRREHEKVGPSSPCSHLRHSQCQWKAALSHFSEGSP